MAVNTALSGNLTTTPAFTSVLSGDRTGSEQGTDPLSIVFAAAGGNAPTIAGFLRANFNAQAGTWQLAHATNPFQGLGSTTGYNQGFTVAGTKIKYIRVRNLDPTNTVTIGKAASNGCTLFNAASAVIIQPGGYYEFYDPAGSASGALTNATNDGITIAVSAGAPNITVLVVYGP